MNSTFKKCQHKWDESDKFRQPCTKCTAIRWLAQKRFPEIGEPSIDWEIMEGIPDLKKYGPRK